MAGTRIFVLQLKDVIKTALFAVLGLALILLLVYLFLPRDRDIEPASAIGSSALYIPGTYSSQIMLRSSPIDVAVTVSSEEILSVRMTNFQETHETIYPLMRPAMDRLAREIIAYQTIELTPSTEFPVTGRLILDAVESALGQARIESDYIVRN